MWTVWRTLRCPDSDLPSSTRSAVFSVAAEAPHGPDGHDGCCGRCGPSFPISLFGILSRGPRSVSAAACAGGQPVPHAPHDECRAGQCLCNHYVAAPATATTTDESVDSAVSSAAAQNKGIFPAQCSVAGGDAGGQGDLDFGPGTRDRRRWVRDVYTF